MTTMSMDASSMWASWSPGPQVMATGGGFVDLPRRSSGVGRRSVTSSSMHLAVLSIAQL